MNVSVKVPALFLCVISFLVICGCSTDERTENQIKSVKIGTATTEGHYFRLGKSIQGILETTNSEISLEVLETKGSVDNIEKLVAGEIDLAIVQNDISFFAENGLPPFSNEMKTLRGVASFYSEPIYLMTNDLTLNYMNQLREKIVNVGPVGSGLFTDVRILLNSLDLWSNISRLNVAPVEGLELLMADEIDAAFTNAILDKHRVALSNKQLKILPVRESTVNMLSNTYPYFERFSLETEGQEISTLAVRAILIANEGIDDVIIQELTSKIFEYHHDLVFPAESEVGLPIDMVNYIPLKAIHEGARSFYEREGLLQPQWLLKSIGYLSLLFLAGFLFVIAANWKILKESNYSSLVKDKFYLLGPLKSAYSYIVRHKYSMVLLTMLSAYMVIIMLVQSIEHNWAIQNNVVSQFDNRSFADNLLWIFVFGGSGYIDNLFPNSPVSKFLVALIRLIGIGGFLALVGLFTSDHIRSRILNTKRNINNMVTDHIILCGWNDNVPFLIKNLLHENVASKKNIVLLAEPNMESPLDVFDIDNEWVSFIRGSATKKNDLEKANLHTADIAIIVADQDSGEPDAKSILKILTIEKFCRDLENEGRRNGRENIYTVAEILDTENFESAYDADVDEIISLGHIKSKIFVHSVLNPGVSNFINEILTYNEFNDIYSIPLKKGHKLIGKTFDELLVLLRKHRILLLSISIGNHKGRQEKLDIRQKNNLNRNVLTNPFTESEINYKTDEDDVLIVLSDFEINVEKAVSNLD